jgi:hypothetical protein
MATDRLTAALTPAIKTIRLRVCRECLATRDMFQSSPSVRRGSERSERIPVIPMLFCGLSIRRPRACRESLDSRDQLTRLRACGNGRPRHGGVLPPARYIYLFRHFCQNSTTSVHYRA